MIRSAAIALGALVAVASAAAAEEDVRVLVTRGCSQDYVRFCGKVPPTGEGMKALECLLKNRKLVSKRCQSALLEAKEVRERSASGSSGLRNWSAQ
jgi:hypothetical protein